MASVTSLDKDLRKLRLDKYTPAAANEVRSWIEGILGERLASGDLLEALKDGVALCKLVNLAIGRPGVRFKQSSMPFVQMENISLFLRACQAPPLNLQEHDMFLTVDLYEQKDPAQVLQCLGAFSRAAHGVNPSAFPSAMGPKSNRGVLSPQSTGSATPIGLRPRGMSSVSSSTSSSVYGRGPNLPPSQPESTGGRWSPTKSPTQNGSTSPVSVSSWSTKAHEGATSPAWNIAQYGYMGGASQGNLGIAFGGRRQITSAGPHVPNPAEKQRKRREQEAEAERQRQLMKEEERRRKAEIEAEEERARLEEERRWEEETRRLREEEQKKLEEEKRKWEEEERQWKITEEKRRKEEEEAEARLREERLRARSKSDAKLRGQFLSQYQAEQEVKEDGYTSRIKQLEQELELAREREAQYERERQGHAARRRGRGDEDAKSRARSRSRHAHAPPARPVSRQDSWSVRDDERQFLGNEWAKHQQEQEAEEAAPPPPPRSARPLPDPTTAAIPPAKVKTHRTGGDGPPVIPVRKHHTGSRPLPDPTQYISSPPPTVTKEKEPERPLPPPQYQPAQKQQPPTPAPLPQQPQYQPRTSPQMSRTDRYLASNPAPKPQLPQQTFARELAGGVDEREAEDRRRAVAQKQTKAGGFASKSLLEREMEMERQRQREWEEAQQETAKAVRAGDGVDGIGGGIGGRWDVSQWSGYTGGDSQNKGQQGIGAGRRQIVGPRPLPGTPGGGGR
ncbi:Transgelin [Rhypophila decipiens]